MDTQPVGRLIVVAGLMLALNAHAFTGKVVGVADGDTITVLRDRTQVKVRLLEIGEFNRVFGAGGFPYQHPYKL